jgi:glycosyltransferase involved in cell wall biosynthesis
MQIAVLINNYNYGHFLERCLASVFAQDRPADEVVLVDDGSTDGSMATISALPEAWRQHLRVVAKENGGQLSAFNAAIDASDSEVVCFLDSDDEFEPGYLQSVASHFEANPGCSVAYSSFYREYLDGARHYVTLPRQPMPSQVLDTVLLLKFCGGPTSTVAFKRTSLQSLRPLGAEDDWRVSADDALVMKAAASDLERWTLPSPLVKYRIHGANLFHGRKVSAASRRLKQERRMRLLASVTARVRALDNTGFLALYRAHASNRPRTLVHAYRYLACILAAGRSPMVRVRMTATFLRWLFST